MKAARKAGRCPQCAGPAASGPDNLFQPFCSERCKLADLGQWFAGRYSIPTEDAGEGLPDAPRDPQSRQ